MLYRFKWPLIVFLVGTGIRILGAMMKIMHWNGADLVILIATIIMLLAIIWGIAFLFRMKQTHQ